MFTTPDASLHTIWGRRAVSALVVLAAIALLGLLAASCGGGGATTTTTAGTSGTSESTPTTAAGGATTTAAGTASTAGAAGLSVLIQNFAFDPATLTVKVGDTVTWTNKDSTEHTVTADNNEFASEKLATGATFTFTFTKAGTYNYHCSIHPTMKASIVVQ